MDRAAKRRCGLVSVAGLVAGMAGCSAETAADAPGEPVGSLEQAHIVSSGMTQIARYTQAWYAHPWCEFGTVHVVSSSHTHKLLPALGQPPSPTPTIGTYREAALKSEGRCVLDLDVRYYNSNGALQMVRENSYLFRSRATVPFEILGCQSNIPGQVVMDVSMTPEMEIMMSNGSPGPSVSFACP